MRVWRRHCAGGHDCEKGLEGVPKEVCSGTAEAAFPEEKGQTKGQTFSSGKAETTTGRPTGRQQLREGSNFTGRPKLSYKQVIFRYGKAQTNVGVPGRLVFIGQPTDINLI